MNRRFFISLLAAIALAPKLVRIGEAVDILQEPKEFEGDIITVTPGTWTKNYSVTTTWEGDTEERCHFTWKEIP